MRRAVVSKLMLLTLAAGSAALNSGCETGTSKEWRKQAETRFSSHRANIHYSLAQQGFDSGDLAKAEQEIMQALETLPEEPRYHVFAARILMERGQLERSYSLLENAVKLEHERQLKLNPDATEEAKSPTLADAYYNIGVVRQRWQRYDEALEAYQRCYFHEPDRPRGLLAAAEMLVKLGRIDEAVSSLEEKLIYFENSPAIRMALGRIHMLRNDHGEALRIYREAALLSNQDPRVLESLAMAEFAAEEYGEAIYHLQILLDTEGYKDRTDLRVTLADCYLITGEPLEARTRFMELSKENPNDVTIWVKLGQAAWMVGDRVRAAEASRRITNLSPNRHEGYMLRGMIELDAGRLPTALRQFDHAANLAPDNHMPWLMRGMTLEQMGDRAGAIESYQRAAEAAPNDPRPRHLLEGLAGVVE